MRIRRLRPEVALVDVLGHGRRDHEQHGVASIDFGGKDGGQRQRAKCSRQLVAQNGGQDEILSVMPGWVTCALIPNSVGTNANSMSATAFQANPRVSDRSLLAPNDF